MTSIAEPALSTALSNPLRAGMRLERTPQPCVMVIFGASGDLAMRKLLPALWALNEAEQLPPGFSTVGVSRSPLSHDDFRDRLRESIADEGPVDETMLDAFMQGLFYSPGDIRS